MLTKMDVKGQSRRVFGLEARRDASRWIAWLTGLGHRRVLSRYRMAMTLGSTAVSGSIGERQLEKASGGCYNRLINVCVFPAGWIIAEVPTSRVPGLYRDERLDIWI